MRVHSKFLKNICVWGLKALKLANPWPRAVKTCNGLEVSELGRAQHGPWSYPNIYPLPIRTYEKRGESPRHLREKSYYTSFLPRVLPSLSGEELQVEGGTQNSIAARIIVGDCCIITFYFVHVINGKLYILISKVVYIFMSTCMLKFSFSLFYSIFYDMIWLFLIFFERVFLL